MINRVYRLKSPGYIEPDFEELPLAEKIIVRPQYLAICAADQRYYMGRRSNKVLEQKLPMALLHEGIGIVLLDASGSFASGEMVVMIPNIPVENCLYIKENYREGNHFLSSGLDGFMQDYIALPARQLVRLPNCAGVSYVFCELLSVACNAITTYQELGRSSGNRFGIWGSGSVGYVTALALRLTYPDAHIVVIGKHREKLQYFSFVDQILTNSENLSKLRFDCCFECVGGGESQSAIAQMIEMTRPQGSIVLMGVNEEPIAINTRLVLEKGLVLLGASRSDRSDFEMAISLIQGNKNAESHLNVIISQLISVRSIEDIHEAFQTDRIVPFKTVMEWRI